MIRVIPLEVIESELTEDTRVSFVVDRADQDTFLPSPDLDRGWVLWLFLGHRDAERMAHLMKKAAPAYKGKDLIALSDSWKNIREGVIANHEEMALISPNDAREYFKEYEEYFVDFE
jgi:hypothetical protein